MKRSPKITAVIPTFNRKQNLLNLLKQLIEQSKTKIQLEIVVVVDGSTDGTLEYIKAYSPNIHTVYGDGTWWYTKSMNEGFTYAFQNLKTDFFLTLNDDIILSDSYLLNVCKAIGNSTSDEILGSYAVTVDIPHKVVFAGIESLNKWIDKTTPYLPSFTFVEDAALLGKVKSVVLPGRGLLIPSKTVKQLNGFDEKFFQYQSDYDFCLRGAKNGVFSYLLKEALIYCYVNQTSASSTFLKPSVITIIKSLFNKTSRYFLPNRSLYYWRHYYKGLWLYYMLKYIFTLFLKAKWV